MGFVLQEVGSGYARRITFDQMTLNGAGNPIIIYQHYCNGARCAEQPKEEVVSEVTFTGVRGTSSVVQAITLDCAAVGCNNIRLNQVDITSSVTGKQITAFCRIANGTSVSTNTSCTLSLKTLTKPKPISDLKKHGS
ncbi:unnamed protein product [Dovyalis caffra]|uniref:Uncharacterized protein n=1 Tax=Dovyalis caffra TaxID=77055 RepID=A0AAV1SNY9_9ROSI|nr:unnamed protein product [Dovyalis caffra]